MSTIYYVQRKDDELCHYGVPGMKWGVRRYKNSDGSLNAAGRARQDYKDSKKELRTANKELRTANKALRRANNFAIGIKGINKANKAQNVVNKAQKNANDAYANTVEKKAKLKAATSKNAEKAEFNAYKKAMGKTGLRGSMADAASGGRSTAIYKSVKAKKGKAYADKLEKRVQNEAIAKFATAVVVSAGAAFASAYLENR